jgi:hypothetical protein
MMPSACRRARRSGSWLPTDPSVVRELRDICGRVAELIDLFAKADIVLEATLHERLSREALASVQQGDTNVGSA